MVIVKIYDCVIHEFQIENFLLNALGIPAFIEMMSTYCVSIMRNLNLKSSTFHLQCYKYNFISAIYRLYLKWVQWSSSIARPSKPEQLLCEINSITSHIVLVLLSTLSLLSIFKTTRPFYIYLKNKRIRTE